MTAPTVHLPTAQHVIRYFCPARSQTILRRLSLLSYVGRPIVLEMKHLYQLIYAFHRILIRTPSLKLLLTPVPGKHTPNEVLQSNVPAEPKPWFLITIGYSPHYKRRLTDQAPRYHYYSLFLQRGNRLSILLCHRHPSPSHHRLPDFH